METIAEQGEKEERASMRPGPATGLARFEGSRAEIAHAAAELLDASGAGDTFRERAACVWPNTTASTSYFRARRRASARSSGSGVSEK